MLVEEKIHFQGPLMKLHIHVLTMRYERNSENSGLSMRVANRPSLSFLSGTRT